MINIADFEGAMEKNSLPKNSDQDRRSETRKSPGRYYSVQFSVSGLASCYQFKLWNVSSKGMCILVKEDSKVVKHLKVDETLEMTYYLTDPQGVSEDLKTKIKHITKNTEGRFRGHYLIGLSIN